MTIPARRSDRGIEAAKAFIFVLTPESVVSEQCRQELETAVQLHKLIIPVIFRDVDRRDLLESLSRPNWIFFNSGHDAERGLDEVIVALEEDLVWRDAHTRLAVRTKEWANSRRDRSFLLRGSDLRSAEEWLGQAAVHEKTAPTALQTEYILASRKAATRTQRTWRTALSVGLAISLGIAAFAFVQRNQAQHEARVAESHALATEAEKVVTTDPVAAARLATAAWRIAPTPSARDSLLQVLAQPERGVLTADPRDVGGVAFSPDGKTLATASGGFRAALERSLSPPDRHTHESWQPIRGRGSLQS